MSSNRSIDALVNRLFQLVLTPGLFSHFHSCVQPDALPRYAFLLPRLAQQFHLSEGLLIPLLHQSLKEVRTPQELFRADDLNSRILREWATHLANPGLLPRLQKLMKSVDCQRLSSTQLSRKISQTLTVLTTQTQPPEFWFFFSLVTTEISRVFPGSECIGVSSLFFLRYFCPLIISFPTISGELDGSAYTSNRNKIAKALQQLSSSIADPVRATSTNLPSKKHFQVMQGFLCTLTTSAKPELQSGAPNPCLSASEITEFFQLVLECAPYYHKQLKVLDEKVEKSWIYLTLEWSAMTDCLLQFSPRSQSAFIFNMNHAAPEGISTEFPRCRLSGRSEER